MDYNKLLAGLERTNEADALRTPVQRKPIPIPWIEGTTPADLAGRSDGSWGAGTRIPRGKGIDADFMRKERERARTALRNEALMETFDQTLDPLGEIAEKMYGKVHNLERYLVEYADVPISAVKGLVKGLLTGGTTLAAIPFKTKKARKTAEALLDDAELTFVLNEVNPLQEARALNEYTRRQSPMEIQAFSDEAVESVLPRSGTTRVPTEGTHRTIINEAMNIGAAKKGLDPVPRAYKTEVSASSPAVFGEDKHLLAVPDENVVSDIRFITDNQEALETILGREPLFFRSQNTMDAADLTPEMRAELVGLKNLQAMNMDLDDYLRGKYEIQMMKGHPEIKGRSAMFESAEGPTLGERGMSHFFNWEPVSPFNIQTPLKGEDFSPARYWESRLVNMLGGSPGSRMHDVVATKRMTPDELKWGLEGSDAYNRGIMDRWVAQHILAGNASPLIKDVDGWAYDQNWLRQLDPLYLAAEEKAMKEAGVKDPFLKLEPVDELRRDVGNRKRDLKAIQDLRLREEGLF